MTDPQRRALAYLAAHDIVTPASLGEGMGGTRRGGAQGLGRLGGAMGARLVKMGLAHNESRHRGGFPAYSISPAGRQALAAAPRPDQPPQTKTAPDEANRLAR